MEISNEIKSKVFAQYLGQKLLANEVYGGFNCELVVNNFTDSLLKGMDIGTAIRYNAKLILKPLSAITDEDAIEVAKIAGTTGDNKYLLYSGTELLEEFLMSGRSNIRGIDWWKVYQYLQSKGYDLPHYLLGGKTLNEAGLAIYE